MASSLAKSTRRAVVEQRLAESGAALAEHLGIEIPTQSVAIRDPELAAIVELERQADLFDAILAAQAKPAPKAEPKPKAKAARDDAAKDGDA